MAKEEIKIIEAKILKIILSYTGELPSKITPHLILQKDDTYLLTIQISTINDKDDSKYDRTKNILLKWRKALINTFSLDFDLNIKEIGF